MNLMPARLERSPAVGMLRRFLGALGPLVEVFTMNDLIRHVPRGQIPRLRDEISRAFGNLAENDSSAVTATWIPAVERARP